MKLIKFKKEISFDDSDKKSSCIPGKKYIVSEGFLEQIKDNVDDAQIESVEHFNEIKEKRYNGQNLDNKKIVIWRTGGMGDLCFITPNLRYIKESFKNTEITFGCGPRFKHGLMYHPFIDNLISLPINYDLLEKNDYYLMFEGIIENNENAKKYNAYDLFESYFGFTGKISKDKKIPVLGLNGDYVNKYSKIYSDFKKKNEVTHRPMIGIGLKASHIIRSIPPNILYGIIMLLVNNGFPVNLLGSKEDSDIVQKMPNMNHNLIFHGYKYSDDFRDTLTMISLVDGVISPDSSTIHIGAAFDKPMVGLYGPFPSKLRTFYYKNCSCFDVKIPCGPCFLHGVETCEYSSENKEPACMHIHKPEYVVQEMITLLEASVNKRTRLKVVK